MDIAKQAGSAVASTLEDFESAQEDEDTLTGHLGAKLRTKSRTVKVREGDPGGDWTWSLTYCKFRGRGPKATEKRLGADGIFELILENGGRKSTKSILFQSKMSGSGGKDIVEQCAKLSTWREAAFVMTYAPNGIMAISIDAALAAKGVLSKTKGKSLDDYLANSFVKCLVGDNDLRYLPATRTLVWHTFNDELVSADFAVKHGFKIKVRAPEVVAIGRKIAAADVHNHRMNATVQDILSLDPSLGKKPSHKIIRNLSKIYHPDLFQTFGKDIQNLMTARMQEFNNANEHMHPKL